MRVALEEPKSHGTIKVDRWLVWTDTVLSHPIPPIINSRLVDRHVSWIDAAWWRGSLALVYGSSRGVCNLPFWVSVAVREDFGFPFVRFVFRWLSLSQRFGGTPVVLGAAEGWWGPPSTLYWQRWERERREERTLSNERYRSTICHMSYVAFYGVVLT